ncbi:MAG: hypothetical protein KUG77_26695 [Nannocystaceae bacterium]|nr:hypothetical protein [Nannocystaceae bacterium]
MTRAWLVLGFLVAGCPAGASEPLDTEAGTESGPGGRTSGEAVTSASTSSRPPSGGETSGVDESTIGAEATGVDPSSSTSGDPGPTNLTPGCGVPMPAQVLDGVITIREQERTYLIEVPRGYDPDTPYPIVFGFHGDGGDSSNARNGYRLSEFYREQAIVVYPDGSGAGGSPAWDTGSDGADVEMVMAIAQEVGLQMCFDLGRVHAFGYSRGAIMSHAMGCYRGDFFTGIGAASGLAPSTGLCQAPIAVFMSHGTADDSIPFNSGVMARDGWVSYNGCSEETTPLRTPGCVRYDGCDEGASVQWCTFDGGHMFDSDYAAAAVRMFQSL